MKRGWTNRHKYLSEAKQRQMLFDHGVEDRGGWTAIYTGREGWADFVQALRQGDEAVVADLRIFGSRKALGEATADVEATGATLVVARTKVEIDPPTVREVHEAERKWAGERGTMGHKKRAKELSKRGHAAYRQKLEQGRMPKEQAEAIWRDVVNYATRWDAAYAMPGWSITKAWRTFGPREKI